MSRIGLACIAAAALTGCATRAPQPQPQPEIIVYVGPKDPAYAIPQHIRDAQLAQHAQRLAAASFQQEAQQVHQRVQADPAFGGFILRWSPEPHAIVMFTGDAAARLKRYTSDPRYRPQRVELTLAELERMKDRFGGELAKLGLRCFSVDGDEENNMVAVGAPPDELARIREAVVKARIWAPRKLRFKEEGCAEFR